MAMFAFLLSLQSLKKKKKDAIPKHICLRAYSLNQFNRVLLFVNSWTVAQIYLLLLLLLSHFTLVRLCATLWTAAHQAPPSLGFSKQEHWSGLPFPSPVHESEKWKWSCSVVPDLATPWTAAYQAPPPMGFSRQEYWSGVPLPFPQIYLDTAKYLNAAYVETNMWQKALTVLFIYSLKIPTYGKNHVLNNWNKLIWNRIFHFVPVNTSKSIFKVFIQIIFLIFIPLADFSRLYFVNQHEKRKIHLFSL